MSAPTSAPLAERGLAETAFLGLLAIGLALLAALSAPWIPVGLLGLMLGVGFLFGRPRLVLAGLLVLLSVYPWLDAAVLPLLPSVASMAAAALKEVVLMGLVLVALFRRRIEYLPGALRVSLAAFAVLILMLAVVPAVPLTPSLLSARFHLQYLLLLPVTASLLDQTRERAMILWAVIGTGGIVAVSWLSALGWTGLSQLDFSMANTAVVLGEDNALVNAINGLGLYMAVLMCLIFGLSMHASTRLGRLVLIGLSVAMGWALLSTFSRRSILALMVGVFAIAVVSRRWKTLIWGGVAGLFVLAYASAHLLWRLSWSTADDTGGLSLRMEHFWYTIESLDPLALFVGHGIGTSGHVAVTAGVARAVDIHNYYLLLVYEAGIVGLGVYLLICWTSARFLVRGYRAGRAAGIDAGLLLGTFGAFAAFLTAGLLGITNATVPIAPLIWALVGAAMSLGQTPWRDNSPSLAPPDRRSHEG